MNKVYKNSILVLSIALLSLGVTYVATANHSWGLYHWARSSNPFTLKLGDNVSSVWDSYLSVASSDWSQSSVLDTTIVSGLAGKNCRPTSGRIEVCNRKYGNNGWLGLAQIWISGSHITQATTKLNDTYFDTANYNTPGWRSLVLCQEVGHNFGLDHQDEDFNNLPITPHTCMDYFVPGATEIVHPNQHDYDQLATIYEHLDSSTTIKADEPSGGGKGKGVEVDLDDPSEWGRSLKKDKNGNDSLFVKDLGNGRKVFTHVFWVR